MEKKGLFFPHGSLYKVGERKPLPIKIMLPPVYIQLSINEIENLKLRKKKTDKVLRHNRFSSYHKYEINQESLN